MENNPIVKTFYLHMANSMKGLSEELERAMNFQIPELRKTHYIVRMRIDSGLPKGDIGITVQVTLVPKRKAHDIGSFEISG